MAINMKPHVPPGDVPMGLAARLIGGSKGTVGVRYARPRELEDQRRRRRAWRRPRARPAANALREASRRAVLISHQTIVLAMASISRVSKGFSCWFEEVFLIRLNRIMSDSRCCESRPGRQDRQLWRCYRTQARSRSRWSLVFDKNLTIFEVRRTLHSASRGGSETDLYRRRRDTRGRRRTGNGSGRRFARGSRAPEGIATTDSANSAR